MSEDEAVEIMMKEIVYSDHVKFTFHDRLRNAYRALIASGMTLTNTPALNGGIRQLDEASASGALNSTSRESLPNNCERCVPITRAAAIEKAFDELYSEFGTSQAGRDMATAIIDILSPHLNLVKE